MIMKAEKIKEENKVDDKELAQRLKRHHQDALSKIIDSYVPYVSTIAYNIAEGSLATSDIEEITADVFVTLWNNADKLNPDKLKAYMPKSMIYRRRLNSLTVPILMKILNRMSCAAA